MAKFRKKPVVIEASQWHQNGDHPEDGKEVFEDGEFEGELLEGKVVRYYRHPDTDGQSECKYCGEIMHDHGWIDTVQGGHIVCPGDWIITDDRVKKDHHGHYYPCKSEIFTETYDEVFTFKIDKPFAAMNNEEICEGCRFFLPILNHCRLNAPIAGAPSGEKWPWVSNGDSCGQYKRKRV